MSTKIHFKTNALLKDVLGRELINDDNIAILELVKNCYDANSSTATVKFVDSSDPVNGEIHIVDRGTGMSRNDITTKWLNIAYSEKKNSDGFNGNLFAGAKGVGRFSCDRLGKKLFVYTRQKDSTIYKLSINWEDFEKDNNGKTEIQKIDIILETISEQKLLVETGISHFSKGTILKISNLRNEWDYDKISSLRKHLEKMINPNVSYVKTAFKIDIVATDFIDSDDELPEFEQVNGLIKNSIFDKLEFRTTRIVSEIDDDPTIIKTTLYDRGRSIFQLKEKNREFPNLKNIKIDLHYLNPYTKVYFKKQSGFRSIDFGSVFLFVNGFRVPPFGEPGNDWLGLDARKAQGHSRYLGSRELVGRIEVLDKNGNFKVISSREGLVKNTSFFELFVNEYKEQAKDTYFFKTLKRLEKYVVEGLDWDKAIGPRNQPLRSYISELERKADSLTFDELKKYEYWETPEKEKIRNIQDSLITIIGGSSKDIFDLTVDPNILDSLYDESIGVQRKILEDFEKYDPKSFSGATKKTIDKIKEILFKAEEKLQKEQAKTKVLEDKLDGTSAKVEELEKKVKVKEKEVADLQEDVQKKKEQIYFHKSQASKDLSHTVTLHHNIGIHTQTINNMLSNFQRKIKDVNQVPKEDVLKLIKKITLVNNTIASITNFATSANFSSESLSKRIDIIVFLTEYIEMLQENNIYQTVNNERLALSVTSNAEVSFFKDAVPIELVMIIDNLISNSIKAHAREFKMSLNIENDFLVISCSDDGKGIKKEHLDKIFESGFTTTYGAGLGLDHVQSVVKKFKGSVEVEELNKGVSFKMRIPK